MIELVWRDSATVTLFYYFVSEQVGMDHSEVRRPSAALHPSDTSLLGHSLRSRLLASGPDPGGSDRQNAFFRVSSLI